MWCGRLCLEGAQIARPAEGDTRSAVLFFGQPSSWKGSASMITRSILLVAVAPASPLRPLSSEEAGLRAIANPVIASAMLRGRPEVCSSLGACAMRG